MDCRDRGDMTADLLLPVLGVLLGRPPAKWQVSLDRAIHLAGWERFTEVLWENRITLRSAYALRGQLPSVPEEAWNTLVSREEARQKEYIELLRLLTDRLDLDFMFIKTLDNFPDLGLDVDLLAREDGRRVARAFQQNGFVHKGQTLAERIADKMSFYFGDYCAAEVHCGRLGEFGEHRELAHHILDNKVSVELEGVGAWVPRRSSSIIVMVLQRLYRHFNLRACDVLNATRWIRSGHVNLEEVYTDAGRFGMLPGVRWFLRFLNEVQVAYGADKVVPTEPLTDVLYCKSLLLRFSRVRFVPSMYGRKLAWSLRGRHLDAARRELLVLPLAPAAFFSHYILKRKALW